MDILNNDDIIHIGASVSVDAELHPATVAYIQLLFKPYIDAMEPANNVEAIKQWIPLAFPGALGVHTLEHVMKACTGINPDPVNPVSVQIVKRATFEFLTAEVLSNSGDITLGFEDKIMLPWDVKLALSKDQDLCQMFDVNTDVNKLEVTVTVGPQEFKHYLSAEFVCGLLIFSHVAKHDFKITIFGELFSIDYIVDVNNRFIDDEETKVVNYSVVIGEHIYMFDSTDFMQGVATGAEWSRVDHHLYWKNLINFQTKIEIGEQITF